MKKIFLMLLICALFVGSLFIYVLYKWEMHRDAPGNISIRINDSEDSYQLYALYSRRKAKRLQSYIDEQLNTDHMFRNSRVDANVTLDDRTNIYVRNIPGRLLIKLNKDQNTAEAYYRIKKLGEGIKSRLAGN